MCTSMRHNAKRGQLSTLRFVFRLSWNTIVPETERLEVPGRNAWRSESRQSFVFTLHRRETLESREIYELVLAAL